MTTLERSKKVFFLFQRRLEPARALHWRVPGKELPLSEEALDQFAHLLAGG